MSDSLRLVPKLVPSKNGEQTARYRNEIPWPLECLHERDFCKSSLASVSAILLRRSLGRRSSSPAGLLISFAESESLVPPIVWIELSRRASSLRPKIVAACYKCSVSERDSTSASTLRERREAVVREHMESENHHDFDTTIATFAHPRYEIMATGDVYDGETEVRGYFAETRTAFPDQRNELIALHHADDAVIVEFDLLGTHLGALRSLPLPAVPSALV